METKIGEFPMEKPNPQRFAEVTNDFIFKKAFASEEDKELLIALLNAFLERKLAFPIKEVTIKNPYIQGQTITSRDAVLDIRCIDEEGNAFIVEMQVSRQAFFFKRAIFYLCMSIANSAKKGGDCDFNFPRTYSLNFLDFDINFGKGCDEAVQYVSLSNEDHPEIRYDYINLVFVRLPRFQKSLDECESLQDRLLYSIRHAHKFDEQPEQLKGGVFDRLFTVLKISTLNPMEYDEYIARKMFRSDRKAEQMEREMLEVALADSEAKLTEREVELANANETIRTTAKKMKLKGLHTSLIAEITGLSVAEIENIL